MSADVCVVIIGRNEGERLKRCLLSAGRLSERIVYVDSGSSDGSPAYAAAKGAVVVQLDARRPFTAGRARNEGFDRARHLWPDARFVQFVDGDCELDGGWLRFARAHLAGNSSWAIVAGRVRERYPHHSVYNLLCDMEWDTPVGEAEACGGIFMVRATAFQAVAGFNPTVIAGEEPELCYRLRQQGWLMYHLDHPMALHDADITYFSQWWRRSVRSGHAYAQGYAIHGREGGGYCLSDSLRIWLWAGALPLVILLLVFVYGWLWLMVLLAYPAQITRVAIHVKRRGCNWRASLLYALFCLVAKMPQMIGQMIFLIRSMSGRGYSIIEYS